MRNVFLHIGYPKCMSTALQRGFFENHPEISFAGIGVGDNISYVNTEIEELFELVFKYSSSAYYKKRRISLFQSISNFIDEASGVVLFSNENLSMNFSLQGIPTSVKYKRLTDVFYEYNLKLILVKRNPIEIIRGVYKEYVRMGYDQTYEEYLKWLIILRDRNFLGDIAFQFKHKELREYFGEDNILWVDYNIHGNPKGTRKYVTEILCDFMNIEFTNKYIIEKTNVSLSEYEIKQLVEINRANKREMGLRSTEPFERHRSKVAFKFSRLNISEEEIFSNVLDKRKVLSLLEYNDILEDKKDNLEEINDNLEEINDNISKMENMIEIIIEEYNSL